MNEQPFLKDVAWVFSKLNDFINNGGGTFRYLIYDVLDYGIEAYSPLYRAGGMDISNFVHQALQAKELNKQLLAACEAAANWTGPDGNGIDEPVLKQLKSAIAKAQGEYDESGI